MINLLPPPRKRELRKEENLKTILNLEALAFFLLLSFGLLLAALLFYLRGKLVLERQVLVGAEKRLGGKNRKAIKREIETSAEIAEKITGYEKGEPSFIALFQKLREALPSEGRLKSFSYSGEEISISGSCPDRACLLSLRKELKKRFENIRLPPSNWAKRENINFLIDITLEDESS